MAKRKQLIAGLAKAYKMLKHVPCPEGCHKGVIYTQTGTMECCNCPLESGECCNNPVMGAIDDYQQCQWCYEVDEIKQLAGIEEESRAK